MWYNIYRRGENLKPKLNNTKGEINMEKYEIGGFYYFKYPYMRNRQTGGRLMGWTDNGMAVMLNKKYGTFFVTVEDLDAHN